MENDRRKLLKECFKKLGIKEATNDMRKIRITKKNSIVFPNIFV